MEPPRNVVHSLLHATQHLPPHGHSQIRVSETSTYNRAFTLAVATVGKLG